MCNSFVLCTLGLAFQQKQAPRGQRMDVNCCPIDSLVDRTHSKGSPGGEGRKVQKGVRGRCEKQRNIIAAVVKDSIHWPQPQHALSIVSIHIPLPFLRSSLCEFDSKNQVSIAVYITMKVSVEERKPIFVVCRRFVCLEWVNTYSRRFSHMPLRHRSDLGN